MRIALIAVALATLVAPAIAGSCEEDLRALDAALETAKSAPDVKAQVADMRNQAQQLCSAGNEEEGADVIAEASALLGME